MVLLEGDALLGALLIVWRLLARFSLSGFLNELVQRASLRE
jgi:hypothetical protein